MLAHMVYFTLKDPSPEAIDRLVRSCHEYLSGHEGTVLFAAGTRNAELARDVNDKSFHVALQLVFADKAAHDRYQDHPRHQSFVETNRDSWAQVRVFDADVESA